MTSSCDWHLSQLSNLSSLYFISYYSRRLAGAFSQMVSGQQKRISDIEQALFSPLPMSQLLIVPSAQANCIAKVRFKEVWGK